MPFQMGSESRYTSIYPAHEALRDDAGEERGEAEHGCEQGGQHCRICRIEHPGGVEGTVRQRVNEMAVRAAGVLLLWPPNRRSWHTPWRCWSACGRLRWQRRGGAPLEPAIPPNRSALGQADGASGHPKSSKSGAGYGAAHPR